jgi:hypothetical protein
LRTSRIWIAQWRSSAAIRCGLIEAEGDVRDVIADAMVFRSDPLRPH